MTCQTLETMFANKLVAATDRFEVQKSVPGRDIYDIHHFFVSGYSYQTVVIEERTGLTVRVYLEELSDFIKTHVTLTIYTTTTGHLECPELNDLARCGRMGTYPYKKVYHWIKVSVMSYIPLAFPSPASRALIIA